MLKIMAPIKLMMMMMMMIKQKFNVLFLVDISSVFCRLIKKLENVNIRTAHSTIRDKWQDRVINLEVLKCINANSIKSMFIKA